MLGFFLSIIMNGFDARVLNTPEPMKADLLTILDTAEAVSIFVRTHQFDPELAKSALFISKLTELALSRYPLCTEEHVEVAPVAPAPVVAEVVPAVVVAEVVPVAVVAPVAEPAPAVAVEPEIVAEPEIAPEA
jgi:hypothetical protein